ncbi:MAG: DUF1919 domain-containing protein [Selenomonadaceae bacterium]|nr:DUF1919 domain-containing protein [Selenomonadaceae bacterium]
MKKVLLWFVSDNTNFLKTALETLDRQQNGIELVGSVTGSEISTCSPDIDYDLLLAVGATKIGMGKVTKIARQLNLPEEKLLGDWIVCIPGFTLEKYRKLQRSCLSIFARNCFGGNISYSLGLPFRSPFVNLFTSEEDFIKFLRAPRIYIEAEPTFEKWTKLYPKLPTVIRFCRSATFPCTCCIIPTRTRQFPSGLSARRESTGTI